MYLHGAWRHVAQPERQRAQVHTLHPGDAAVIDKVDAHQTAAFLLPLHDHTTTILTVEVYALHKICA